MAEFIVAKALAISTVGVRDEWAAYDLILSDGVRVEVKSAAYIQSWAQKGLSSIQFLAPKTRGWDPDTGLQAAEAKRQADVYVFALLAHMDKPTVDPLDLSQWRFYVLSSAALDARMRSQHSITLKTLESISGGSVEYGSLRALVAQVTAREGKRIVQQNGCTEPGDGALVPNRTSVAPGR